MYHRLDLQGKAVTVSLYCLKKNKNIALCHGLKLNALYIQNEQLLDF